MALKEQISKNAGLLALIILVWFIGGCGASETGTTTTTTNSTSTSTSTIAKSLSSITISPSNVTLLFGSSEVFSSTAIYSDSTTAPINATWSVFPTDLGQITTAGSNGLFVVTTTSAESGFVIATYNGLYAYASVSVSAP
jgi:hypothetical protein